MNQPSKTDLEDRIDAVLRGRERSLSYTLGLLKASRDIRSHLHENATRRLRSQIAENRNALLSFDSLHRYTSAARDPTTMEKYERRILELEHDLAHEERDFWKDTLELDRTIQAYEAKLARDRTLRTLRDA